MSVVSRSSPDMFAMFEEDAIVIDGTYHDDDLVSLGDEHEDNLTLAEASEMWMSVKDSAAEPVTLEQPTLSSTHHTPVLSPHPQPVSSPADQLSSKSPVIPLPDYHSIHTPHIRAELKKFGLKEVPHRKACLLLNHIYMKTHPLVPSIPLHSESAGNRKKARNELDIKKKK